MSPLSAMAVAVQATDELTKMQANAATSRQINRAILHKRMRPKGKAVSFMRVLCVALILGVTATGASASSFLTVGTPAATSTGSFVYLGRPATEPATAPAAAVASPGLPALSYPTQAPPALAAAAPAAQSSPSIVVMGEPAVENFKVAAIAEKKPANRRLDLAPMVIRGGISGEMFARESPPAGVPASSSSAQPEPVQAAAAPTASKSKPRQPTPPQPEPAAAPQPSNLGTVPGVQ
jgi:hypothetical protein